MDGKKFLKIIAVVAIVFGGLTIVWIAAVSFLAIGAKKTIENKIGYGSAGMIEADRGVVSFDMQKEMAPMASAPAEFYGRADAVAAPAAEKKIIKTGNLSLKAEKTETAAQAVGNIARLNQGEVYSSNFYDSGRGAKAGYLTIRVPAANFEKTFSAIKEVATQVINESTNAQDITEQYIDLEARLKNKLAEEESFVKLLNRSGKMEEVLAVTRELARVRGEIEQLAGQKRYLDSQTDMSTITVYLSEDAQVTPVARDWRPWQVVKDSAREFFDKGQDFVNGLIRFAIVGLPALLIYLLFVWLLYRLGRRIYRHYRKEGGK